MSQQGIHFYARKNVNPRTGEAITPTIETYEKVARAMGLTLEDLLAKKQSSDVASFIFDNEEVRKVAKVRLAGLSPKELNIKRRQLVGILEALWSAEVINFGRSHEER